MASAQEHFFPPGSGGGGGGSNPCNVGTALQYNASNTFGCVTGSSWDGTTLGLPQWSLSVNNPTTGNNPGDRRAISITVTGDSSNTTPGFTDVNAVEINETLTNGDNVYGGGTNAKTTPIALNIQSTYIGAGEKFGVGNTVVCTGMGDCFGDSVSVTYAGADISGDEGQGLGAHSPIQQQGVLTLSQLTADAIRTACNTTTTAGITASETAQAVPVVSTTGCNTNDWIVVNQEVATGTPNHEAVQIISVAGGSITGIFRTNQSSGVTITAATVLETSGATGASFGQGRVLVNLDGTTYGTGTVSGIANFTVTGSGTTWTVGMVGGSTKNVGCIVFTPDNYNGAPFNGSGNSGVLHSYYQIKTVVSATSLTGHSYSTAGSQDYRGKAPGAGGYTIYPCVQVLGVNGNELIAETTSTTWSNTHHVELAVAPYPDSTGRFIDLTAYTPGGSYRDGITISNLGARAFNAGVAVHGDTMKTGSNADAVGFADGFSADTVTTGVSLIRTQDAIDIFSDKDHLGKISFQENANIGIYPAFNGGGTTFGLELIASDNVNSNYVRWDFTNGGFTYSTSDGPKAIFAGTGSLSADRTFTMPDASGTIALISNLIKNGMPLFGGTAPTMGTCGMTPTLATGATNNAFTVNVGSGAVTSCTVNFGQNFTNNPSCTLADDSTSISGDISSVSTSSVTFSFSLSLGSGHIYAHCF